VLLEIIPLSSLRGAEGPEAGAVAAIGKINSRLLQLATNLKNATVHASHSRPSSPFTFIRTPQARYFEGELEVQATYTRAAPEVRITSTVT
jgi:hypothetical protein